MLSFFGDVRSVDFAGIELDAEWKDSDEDLFANLNNGDVD